MPQRWFRTIQLGSIVLPLVACVTWGAVAWREQKADAIAHAGDSVELVRQYSQRLIETEIVKHGAARSRMLGEDAEFIRSRTFHEFLASIDGRAPGNFSLVVISSDGKMTASSRSFPVNFRVGQRDYVDAIRGGSQLFVDRIRLQPGGEDAIIVATPFITGAFEGMIVSSIDAENSRSFLRSITVNDGEAASLMRDDGKLLVRQVPGEPIFLAPDTPARQETARASEGVYEAVAASDGTRRIYAFSHLGRLPLVAHFGVSTAGVSKATVQRALPVWLLMTGMGAFTFVANSLARRSMVAQREKELNALQLTEAKKLADQRAELVREMNHRVKNNLTLVTSLISIQSRRGSINAHELHLRVRALAQVHDLLYQTNHNDVIDLRDLLRGALDPATVLPDEQNIKLALSLPDPVQISADRASPLTLAVLELVTNAVKHAFVGRNAGTITVQLTEADSGCGVLVIEDDGIGMPPHTQRRSGTGLVNAFVQQVGGEITMEVDGGTRYTILFRIDS
jgi:two-component sensor histidine kinase